MSRPRELSLTFIKFLFFIYLNFAINYVKASFYLNTSNSYIYTSLNSPLVVLAYVVAFLVVGLLISISLVASKKSSLPLEPSRVSVVVTLDPSSTLPRVAIKSASGSSSSASELVSSRSVRLVIIVCYVVLSS